MARLFQDTFTQDGFFDIQCESAENYKSNDYTVMCSGTFGGGTVDILVSNDGGASFIADIAEIATTFTAPFARTIELNAGSNANDVILRISLAGSLNADVFVSVDDTD